MTSDTAKILIVFTIIAVLSTLTIFSYNDAMAQKQLDLKNQRCIKLGEDLLEFNKTCECYYGNCNAETKQVQDATTSYCVCNCLQNDSLVSICVRQTV